MRKTANFLRAAILMTFSALAAVPAHAAAAAPARGGLQESVTSLWELIMAGGSSMILQGFLSVVAVAFIIYHFRFVKMEKLLPHDFIENLFLLLERKEYEKAMSVSKTQQNMASAIALSVLPRLQKGSKMTPGQIESLVQVEGRTQTEKLWQNLTYLGDVAVVAPLVGLLGTVIGMINAFHFFKAGTVHPGVLTQGLAKAMVNTVAGLIVAIICLMFYSYFRGKISAIVSRAEAVASEMTQVLSR